jgi:hypothetical protein
LNLRGETRVFVALKDNSIIGSLCVSLQQTYIGGECHPVYYIGDFKVDTAYRNQGIGLELTNLLADYLFSADANLAFLNISKGNTKPLSFFKNRPNVPDFENIGVFNIHQFFARRNEWVRSPYKIEETTVSNELLIFLNSHYKKYELGPVITSKNLEGNLIAVTRDQNGIIGCICLQDTMDFKQNVVTRVSFKMKILLRIINLCSAVLRISRMPEMNEPVTMIYAKYLAVRDNDSELVKILVNYSRNIAYKKAYSFVSVGLHEKDPLEKIFKNMFKLTFHSVGMFVSIKNNREIIQKVKMGIPFEDYSLV